MQITLDSLRHIRQWGERVGELTGCTVLDLDEATAQAVRAAAATQPYDYLVLNLNGTVTVVYDAAGHLAEEQARAAADAITAAQGVEARDYQAQLDQAITFFEGTVAAWPGMTANAKQQWLANHFDKVLRVNLGLVRMVRWAARRLGL
jgi:hypothetical protein